jgi:hypothetical protein
MKDIRNQRPVGSIGPVVVRTAAPKPPQEVRVRI